MNMLELSKNCMYVKDDWCRYRDYNIDVGLIDFIVEISNKLGGNIITADGDYEVISEELWNNLQCGYDNIDGIIALLYTRLAALANLRRRLKEYEDLKLTPEQIREIDNLYSEQAKELGEYKDAEKQGKLLKLPCAVGDRIYRINTDEKLESREIEIYDIDNIVILADGTILLKYDVYDGVICELENIVSEKPYLDFYRCFLTKSAAEQALKEMEDKHE